MTDVIRVLLADDHPTLRVGLRVLLDQAPDIEVVGEADTGAETLARLEMLQPDVVVLDCQLPDMEGPEVAREMRRRGLEVQILALSGYDDDRYLQGMWVAGAVGYLLKSEAPNAIVAAVQAAARGASFWTAAQTDRIRDWQAEVEQRWNALTEREREVLALVAAGKSNKEIAQTLEVTERTVEFHVGNVLGKLGVGSRVEAAVWVKEHPLAG